MSTGKPQARAHPIAAAELRHHVLNSDVPQWLKDELCRAIRRNEEPQGGWAFVFVSPKRNEQVVEFCLSTDRPRAAVRLWALILSSLASDTGEILLARDEISERLGVASANVSRLMSALERFGAIRRERVRIAGLRGPGASRYFVNPDCVWRGPLAEREQQAQEKPIALYLELIQGGKND